ncbi:MAG: ABC transporter substrate-binding protein [Syntrophomonadaceae bacterium]|nr:ABC transporter substrate-binding protein [Syntrophomonadaceae bacterium]
MKKLIVYLLVLLMGLTTLSGCASKNETADKKLKIGIVQPMDHPSLNQIRETIIAELQAQGMGDKIEIIEKNANGDMSLLPSIMQDLLNDKVDLIVPIATPAAQAARAATTTVPIVFSAVSNPVEAGLVTSFDATTGNITGVSNSIPIEDIFKLAATITPDAKVFGLVYNSSEINSTSGIAKAKAYCDKNGLKYKEAAITSTADVQQAATSLVGQIDAFFTPNDNTVASAMATYVKVATDAKLPIYAGADSMVNDGALATVGIDYTKLGKQTAAMIIRIINGQTIKDTHVEQVAEYANMINMNTADKLGLIISDELKQKFVILGK